MNDFIVFIVENRYIFIAFLAILACIFLTINTFVKMPTDKKFAKIKEWMKENMNMFDRELKDQYITKKNCIGLSKRVTNLEVRLHRLKIKYTFLFSYAAIVSAIVFFLLYYLKIN